MKVTVVAILLTLSLFFLIQSSDVVTFKKVKPQTTIGEAYESSKLEVHWERLWPYISDRLTDMKQGFISQVKRCQLKIKKFLQERAHLPSVPPGTDHVFC